MTDQKAILGAEIFDGQKRHKNSALIISEGHVVAIKPEHVLPADCVQTKLDGGLIAPGFVDLQVNGGGGAMLNNSPTVDTIQTICEAHAKLGTTSLLPTFITDTPAQTSAVIRAVREAIAQGVKGLLGLHLEGPYLSQTRSGAHAPSLVRSMQEADCQELEALAADLPVLFLTVAAEAVLPEQVERLIAAGAVISLGHSDCTFTEAMRLVEKGASCVTHIFNAMSQFGGREAGLVGAALESGCLNASLIADGHHVDGASIPIAMRAKRGPGKIFLVSDSMATTGTTLENFTLNGRQVSRQNDRLTLADGTLAGADLDLARAVRFMKNQLALPGNEALRMASLYPAQVIRLENDIGSLAAGTRADFVHLSDSFELVSTWQGGRPLEQL